MEHQRQGLILAAVRGFFLTWPIATAPVTQTLTACLAWGCLLLIATPPYTSISPGQRVPVIPMPRPARIAGAVTALHWWELIPAIALLVYRFATGALETPGAVATAAACTLVLAASFGLIRAGVDDLLDRWPTVFYRSPYAGVLLTPVIFGTVGTHIGANADQSSTISTVVLVSLFPLYLSTVSRHNYALLTITVPGLTTRLFRKQVRWAAACAFVGGTLGYLLLRVPLSLSCVIAAALASIVALWLGLAWGGGFPRAFTLMLAAAVPAGAISGISASGQSAVTLTAIAGLAVIMAGVAYLRLHSLRDAAIAGLISGS